MINNNSNNSNNQSGSSYSNEQQQQQLPARTKIEQIEFLQSQKIPVQILDLALYKSANKTQLKATEADLIRLCKLVQLTELDLTGNDVRELPETISQLYSLRVLKLNRSQLRVLPRNLDMLSGSLQQLHLQLNDLSTWPQSVNKFANLEVLDLSFNQINKISFSNSGGILSSLFGSGGSPIVPIQQSLKVLDLGFNQFHTFPAKLAEFSQLQSLRLSKNNIEEVPESIIRLKDTLTNLNIDKCGLREFPRAVCELTRLKVLNISENRISKLPMHDLRMLNQLEELYANDCNITAWSQFCSLEELRILHLSKNNILGLPTEIKSLRYLQELRLNGNRINHLPAHITQLTFLEILDLSDNSITEIDEGIGSFSHLQSLNLANNQIEYLPRSMQYLSRLQTLNVSSNMIDQMFDWSLMQELREVKASNNLIRSFPTGISENPFIQNTLSVLDFTMNRIPELPESFYMLKSLTQARLKHNLIEELDSRIEQMDSLIQLNLDNNGLTTIPNSITKLTKLTSLCVSFNHQHLEISDEVQQWITTNNVSFTNQFEVASQIGKGLFIGSANASTNKHLLKAYGVTHVLTIANDIPPKYTDDFKYMVIYTDDVRTASLKAHFYETAEFIKEGIEAGGCIVHCMAGVSRSATIMTAFIMQYKQLRVKTAFRYLGERRPQVSPNPTFRTELQLFEKEFFDGAPVVEKPKNRFAIFDPATKEKTTYYPDGTTEKQPIDRPPTQPTIELTPKSNQYMIQQDGQLLEMDAEQTEPPSLLNLSPIKE